jgi:hypothetical protein
MPADRALRNNNPGNIDAGDHWRGLCPVDQMTPEQKAETRFAVFASPQYGFRALAIILLNYQKIHGLKSIGQCISRWAPNSENNTTAYILAVANYMQVGPDAPLDLTNPTVLSQACKGIAIHESGGWVFQDIDLQAGVTMAEAI